MTNYSNGAAKERRVLERYKKIGFDICLRSAGSHSAIDCVCINTKTKVIKMLQVKPKSMSDKAVERLQAILQPLSDEYIVTFEVVT
jgi:Holliday junction resolvase